MSGTIERSVWRHLTTSYYFGIINLTVPAVFVTYVGILTATLSKSELSDPGFTIKVLFELTSHITSILGAFFLYNSLERVRSSHEKRVHIHHSFALCMARTKAMTNEQNPKENIDAEYARKAHGFLQLIHKHGQKPYDKSRQDEAVEALLQGLRDVWREEIKQIEKGQSIYKYYTSDLKSLLHSVLYLQSFARSRINSDVVPVLHLSAIMLGILLPFEIYDSDPQTHTYNAMWQMTFVSYIVACIAQITVFCETPELVFTSTDTLVQEPDKHRPKEFKKASFVLNIPSGR